MIHVEVCDPPRAVLEDLAQWQGEVDRFRRRSYRAHVDAAEREYARRRTQSAFAPVATLLREMCSGIARCMYCEDSCGTDVEHYQPKVRYPELVFAWANFLLVCARCNRRKSSSFPLFDKRGVSLRTATSTDSTRRPPKADAVLLNPRVVDPSEFLMLDLASTYYLVERAATGTAKWLRARHTVSVLELNDDVLLRSRRNAYRLYLACLHSAVDAQQRRDEARIRRAHDTIVDTSCSFVWREMQRQHTAIPELCDAFAALPDALRW